MYESIVIAQAILQEQRINQEIAERRAFCCLDAPPTAKQGRYTTLTARLRRAAHMS